MKKIKNNPVLIVILFIVCWNLLFAPILFISAKHRANRVLNPYIQELKNSIVINKEFGKVKKVKVSNIINYSKRKMKHACFGMKVTTNSGKYDICIIAENNFQGYIYNKKIYKEITTKSTFEVDNYNEDFKKELNSYLNKAVDYPKSREPIVYKIDDGKYQLINICKYKKEDECNQTNELYFNNLVDAFKDKYKINRVQEINTSDISNTIKDNFSKISEFSDLTSSNPHDYIKNEYYNNIVNLGKDAVPILKEMYDKGELSGLNAYISALAIQEITQCNLHDKYNLNWSTAEEFYKLWKDNNCEFNK